MPRDRHYTPGVGQDPKDPTTWTAVHTDATTASEAVRGWGFAYAADLEFDSLVRPALDGGGAPILDANGQPEADTRIEWDAVGGDAQTVRVEASLNNGGAWLPCINGGRVPGIRAGQSTVNQSLLLRQVFCGAISGGVPAKLARLEVWIHYENDVNNEAQTLHRLENGAAWSAGSLHGCETDGVTTYPAQQRALAFNGAGGYVRLGSTGSTPLDASHGDLLTMSDRWPGHVFALADYLAAASSSSEATRIYDEAAFSFECRIVPAVDGTGHIPDAFICGWHEAGWGGVQLRIVNGSPQLVAPYVNAASESGHLLLGGWGFNSLPTFNNLVIAPSLTLQAGLSYRLSFTYDGVHATLFVDGRLQGLDGIDLPCNWNGPGAATKPKRLVGGVLSTRGNFFIGAVDPASAQKPFHGAISDVRVWKRRITVGEVNRWKARPLTDAEIARQPALMLYWRCDEADNADLTCADASGHDVAGTIYRPGNATGPDDVHRGLVPSWNGLPESDGTTIAILPYRLSPALPLTVMGKAIYVTTAPFDLVANGHTYKGIAHLGAVSAPAETSRLEATGIDLAMAGIPRDYIAVAFNQTYLDRICRLYGIWFAPETNEPTGPLMLFEGRMDVMNVSVGADATVTVRAESLLVDWNRARSRRWNAADQRDRYPDDRGLDFVAEASERDIWWPAKFTISTK